MGQYKYAEIGDTVYFWFAANTTAGAAGDGATPLFDVRLAGAAAGAIPTASGTPTLLTHANYTDGLHEIAIDTTGYAAGEYAVFCTLTISSVNPAGFAGSFKLRTAGTAALAVDTVAISGDATAADNCELMFDGTGYAGGTTKLGVSLVQILGTAITETAGQIAAAFTKFFDKAVPTGTVNSIPDAVAGAAGGIAIVGSEMAANLTKVNGAAQTATLDTIKTVVDTIQADTDLLDDVSGGLADIHTDIAAVKSDTAATLSESQSHPTLAEIEASAVLAKETTVAARATPAQVNAEVLDVLNVDTFAEPGQEAPAATNTLAKKIGYLFKFLRNKVTQDATTLSVFNDAGTVVDQKATVSDDATTYTRGEIGSGP